MVNSQLLAAVLNHPYPSFPTSFAIEGSGKDLHIFHSFLNTRTSPHLKTVSGSIVSHPDVPGASAMVIAGTGLVGGKRSQRLLIKTKSPFNTPLTLTADIFLPVFDSTDASGNVAADLCMTITRGIHPTEDTATIDPKMIRFPLIVSPDSVVLGSLNQADLTAATALGLDFNSLLDIAKKVAPVVAKAGYDIYNELQKTDNNSSDTLYSFWDTVGSIAKIAVPIAGSLLAA